MLVGHGLLVAAMKSACGIDVDIVGATCIQQSAQRVLKKGVMKLLHEIHRGEEPVLQLVRMDGLEEAVYLVTISAEVVPQSDIAWHSLTSDIVRAGLEESDQWSFLSGLLLDWPGCK